MGVNGLQSFLKANRGALADEVQLQNTSLVIDCNNLQFYLFERSCIVEQSPNFRSDIYGGNLFSFGRLVREFFEALNKCGITPILVVDGSTQVKADALASGEIMKEVIKKSILDNLEAAKNLNEYNVFATKRSSESYNRFQSSSRSRNTGGNQQIRLNRPNNRFDMSMKIFIPRVIKSVFRGIVKELDIEVRQAAYEANCDVVKIANELECPVLGNDSDFIIYPIKKGFIILSSFYYKNLQDTDHITCSIFQREKLVQLFPGLEPDCLAMMNLLMGREATESQRFSKLVEFIRDENYGGELVARSPSNKKIATMLTWLSKRSFDDTLKLVLESVESEHHDEIKKALEQMLQTYRLEKSYDFGDVLERIYPPIEIKKSDDSVETPANYLLKLFNKSGLGGTTMSIIFGSVYYENTFLEDFSKPSVCLVRFRPTAMSMVLLRPKSYKDLTEEEIQIKRKEDALRTYIRVGETYQEQLIEPLVELEGYGSLNHLDCYSMIQLDEEQRRLILMSTFRFDQSKWAEMIKTLSELIDDESYLLEATVCMLLVNYVGVETEKEPKNSFAHALILILLWYGERDGLLNSKTLPDKTRKQLMDDIRQHSSKYHGWRNHSTSAYRPIIHMITSLETAYRSYFMLNSLLGEVFHVPKLDKWFNGKMIFRTVEALKSAGGNLDKFCSNPSEPLKQVFKSIAKQVNCIPML